MSIQIKLYEKLAKPVFFKIDPELTHDLVTYAGIFLGSNIVTKFITNFFFNYKNKALNINIKGINFPNPVGLAAGFDKNAKLVDIMPYTGFGFEEVGSITANPCNGNPKPRVFRLPKDNSIIVNYGLCNDGANIICKRLKNMKFKIPLGISIAKTNDFNIKGNDSVNDYYKSYNSAKNIGDYITINISCPNTGDGRSFEDPVLLELLLKKIKNPKKPVFLKLSPDLLREKLDKILDLGEKYGISGFILTNLTHDRTNLKTSKKYWQNKKGGISGLPVKNKSNDILKYVYNKTKGKFILISVGGIFTAEDAYDRIKNGASLVQLITGMIYKGPALIKHINTGLVRLLKEDGYKNIQEAIGTNVRT
ncbi:MAG: quinone-dependent dihydroorotate dehydrogenase [Nanoarchaeota archaeon]